MPINSHVAIFLFFCLLPLVYLGSDTESESDSDSEFVPKCKASEDYSALLPCVNLTNGLDDLFMEYDKIQIPEDVHQNMTEMCGIVITCFNSSECKTNQDYKQYYEAKCQNLEFQKVDLHECISQVYNTMYDGSYNCIEMYHFLSEDVAQKRDSFDTGKFCFLQIVGKKCSPETNEFITTNYEKVVDVLTVKPEGASCAEPFHDFHFQQCLAGMNQAKAKIAEVFGKDAPTIFDQRWSEVCEVCQKAQECVHNCCQFDDHDRAAIDSLCSTFQLIDSEECLIKLHEEKSDFANFSCLEGIHSANQTIWQESCTLHEALKNCTMRKLKDELNKYCGAAVIQAHNDNATEILDLMNSNNCTSENEC